MSRWATATLVLALATVLLLGVIVWQRRQLEAKQEQVDELIWTLKDGTATVTPAVATSLVPAASAAGIDLGAVSADASKHGATPQAVTTATAATPGRRATGLASTGETPRPASSTPPDPPVAAPVVPIAACPAESPYMRATEHLDLVEPVAKDAPAVPWGKVSFSAWEARPWALDVLPRNYRAATIIATDEAGAIRAYSKLSVAVEGKDYVLPVTHMGTTTVLPQARFRFSPGVYFGADAGAFVSALRFDVLPTAQVGLWSYGRTSLAPEFAFALLGVGYAVTAREPVFVLSPITVNIGSFLPIVDNFHVVPTVGLSLTGEWMMLAGIRAKL